MFALTRSIKFAAPAQQRTFVSLKQMRSKKFKSILDQVPPRPRSGWQVYVRNHLKEFNTPEGKISVSEATKGLSSKWRAMSDAEKQTYIDLYEKEAEIHHKAYEKALKNASAKQLYEENLLRKKYKLKELPDPNVPRRPAMNGYMFYLKKRRTDPSFKTIPLMEQSTTASKEFKALPDSEKEVYNKMAKEALAKYHEEKAQYISRMTEKQ